MAHRSPQPPAPSPATLAAALPIVPAAQALGIRNLLGAESFDPEGYVGRHDSAGDWIFLATRSGAASVRSDNAIITADPESLLVITPHTRFEETTLPGTPWTWTCLRLTLEPDNPILPQMRQTPWVGHPGLRPCQCMHEIILMLHERCGGFELDAIGSLLELLSLTKRLLAGMEFRQQTPCIDAMCDRMRRNLSQAWSVAGMARECHMSESAFAHRFRAQIGVSPRQWLTDQRMREARRLLMEQHSIDDVADRLGYSSRYHFSLTFRQREGISPGRFRRLISRKLQT